MPETVDGEWAYVIPPWYGYGFAYQGMMPRTYAPVVELTGGTYQDDFTDGYGGY